jgi:hypothetical protein
VGTVVRGDIITGQGASPKWVKLAIGSVGTILSSDGTDVKYQTAATLNISTTSHTHAQLHDAITLATNHGLSLSTQVLAMGTPSTITAITTNVVTTNTHTHAITGFSETSHTHAQLHDALTLATNHGLGLSGQVLNMGTPSTITAATTNSVTTNTHTHAITGFALAGAAPTAHQLDGALHTVSGLTLGHFLKATSATTFGFAAHGLTYTDVGAAAVGHTHAQLHDAITLATNHGLGLSGQVLNMGTPSTCTNVTTNAVTTTTHTHAITGFALSGAISGTQNYVSKFNAAGTGIINSLIYDDGVAVGIGTTTLTTVKLTIADTAYTGVNRLIFLENRYSAASIWGGSSISIGYYIGYENYSSRIIGYSNAYATRATRLQLQTHSSTDGVFNYGIMINEDGQVGIGQYPQYTLDVVGSARVSTIGALATPATVFMTHTAGLMQSRTAAQVLSDIGAAASLSGTQYRVMRFATTTTAGDTNIYTNAAGTMMGVGVSPTNTLHIRGDGSTTGRIIIDDGTYSINIGQWSTSSRIESSGAYDFRVSNYNSKDLIFETATNTERLRIYGATSNYVARFSGLNISLTDYTTISRMYSGADAVFGYNIYADLTTRVLKQSNTGYYANWIRLYSNGGIYFGTSTVAGTAGTTICDPSGTTNEKMVLTNAGKLGIGVLSSLVGMVDINAGTSIPLITRDANGCGIYFGNADVPYGSEINCGYGVNSVHSLDINSHGYQNGRAHLRDTYIYDGKGNAVVIVYAYGRYVGIGSDSAPLYTLDVSPTTTTTAICARFAQPLSTGNSTRINLGRDVTTGNSVQFSYTWLSDNHVSNRFDLGFLGKEASPNFCAYNDGRIVIGGFAPWDYNYGLTINQESGGNLFVETSLGTGIQFFGSQSNGEFHNRIEAVAVGGEHPAFLYLSVGTNYAMKFNEAGDTFIFGKVGFNGNAPVGKAATATTLAQVITCLQDAGLMS